MKVKAHPLNMPVYTTLITMCCCGGRFMDAASYSVEMTEMGFGSYITERDEKYNTFCATTVTFASRYLTKRYKLHNQRFKPI
ncbi:hypothetical protein YC2023_119445 [Brassica napus]